MDDQSWENTTRRRVLIGLANVSLAGALLSLGRGALDFLIPPLALHAPAEITAGPPEQFAAGLTPLPDASVFIGRDQAGLFAVSAVCTHLGCTVTRTDNELACPCHASRFALDGTRLAGPATQSLPQLKLSLTDDGLLKVHLTEPVPPATRLTVF